ncbi:MAG: hypothetical protein AAF405_00250 [Pseudomonadota bacterium]
MPRAKLDPRWNSTKERQAEVLTYVTGPNAGRYIMREIAAAMRITEKMANNDLHRLRKAGEEVVLRGRKKADNVKPEPDPVHIHSTELAGVKSRTYSDSPEQAEAFQQRYEAAVRRAMQRRAAA